MPAAADRWCPTCRAPHKARQECPRTKAERLARIDAQRPGPRQRGYDSRWDEARGHFLKAHPLCACGRLAAEVHHGTPHRGDMKLFWDRSRWIGMCKSCHSAATAREINERRVPRYA
jgi:5-methylcytosine-specific restriction protein A